MVSKREIAENLLRLLVDSMGKKKALNEINKLREARGYKKLKEATLDRYLKGYKHTLIPARTMVIVTEVANRLFGTLYSSNVA